MKETTILLLIVTVVAAVGIVLLASEGTTGNLVGVSGCEGRMQWVVDHGGQAAWMCTTTNLPVGAPQEPLSEEVYRGVPTEASQWKSASFGRYPHRFPDAKTVYQ